MPNAFVQVAIDPLVKVGVIYKHTPCVIVPLPVGATIGEKLTPDCAAIVSVATAMLPAMCKHDVGALVPIPTLPAIIAPLVVGATEAL